MSDKEEEFPFEDFLDALSSNGNLKKDIQHILSVICSKNMYTNPHVATGPIPPFLPSSKYSKAKMNNLPSNAEHWRLSACSFKHASTPSWFSCSCT